MGMVQQVLAEGMEYREETDLGALRGPVDRICGLIVQWAVAERVVHLAGDIYDYR